MTEHEKYREMLKDPRNLRAAAAMLAPFAHPRGETWWRCGHVTKELTSDAALDFLFDAANGKANETDLAEFTNRLGNENA